MYLCITNNRAPTALYMTLFAVALNLFTDQRKVFWKDETNNTPIHYAVFCCG